MLTKTNPKELPMESPNPGVRLGWGLFAWRNIWRNKRRTLITTASIFFGVVLSIFMSSMQEGSYAQYIKAIVNSYSGYIQIHKNGYWKDKSINNLFTYDQSLKDRVKGIEAITLITPRLESNALASSEEITKVVAVMGINPSQEDRITKISTKLIKGNYLGNNAAGVVIGSDLAKYMKLDLNDTLVLISQGYHGASAAGKYPVRGIIKHPSPDLNRSIVYMDIKKCQDLYSAPDMLTSLVMMVRNDDDVAPTQQKLNTKLGRNFEVMNWKEMNYLLLKQIDSDRQSGYIIKGILYMIIAFGILGTIMMMMAERKKELGIIVAIGMQKLRLAYVLVLETIFIGMTGVIAGIAAGIPLTWYFKLHPIPLTGQAAEVTSQMGFEPIMSFSMMPSIYYSQALTVLIFTLIIGIYPVYNIVRLKIIKALHG